MSDDTTTGSGEQATGVRDRRTVLRGAAVAGLAGVGAPLLAACGDDGSAGGTPSTTTTGSAPTTATTPSGPGSSTPPPAGGPVLGPAADVPVGGGKAYPDAKVVVTQPTAGQYKAFSAVCTHAGCALKEVANGTINCNCHGSKFAIADGSVTAGPAKEPLPAANVTVQGGNLIGPAA